MENVWVPDLVKLDLIDPNPWQVREEDKAHVADVAQSIAVHGLLQPGIGRWVDGRVQLALAHMRLAAFRFLDAQFGADLLHSINGIGNGQAGDQYAAFPVVIRELSDEQMAAFAIEENFKRKDLTAIEKGRALKRYMADFRKTQAEAGERFNLTQSAVSHLITLVESLPEELQELVAQRKLAERHARVLVPVAKLSVENAVGIGKAIAEADPAESDQVASDALTDFCTSEGRGMGDCHWPPDWKPEAVLNGEPLPACKGCPAFFKDRFEDDYCLRPECMEAKIQAWEEKELARLSEKFGIPFVAVEDEHFKPLNLAYSNEAAARNILKRKNKPECLRLVPARGQKGVSSYQHRQLLGSDVVLLASSDPHVLDPNASRKAPAPVAASGASAEEIEAAAERARQAQKEQEEREAEGRRSERAAMRRAMHDIPWLIFHTAEVCGEQLQVSGVALEWMSDLVFNDAHLPIDWSQFTDEQERLAAQIEEANGEAQEILVRRQMLAHRFADQIWTGYDPKQAYDWPRALDAVQEICKDLNLKPGRGWNEPPIHKTETNCHTCGRFTSMDRITARDGEEGWRVDDGVVTCSEECRAGSTKGAKVAKKQVAGRKSQPAKKSQAKGKRR